MADLTERGDVDRVVELPVPVRVQPMTNLRSRRRFDRCGRVVAGVVPGGREPADVAAVADQVARDDRTDTEHVGDRRVRDAATALSMRSMELDERLVVATDLVEELDRDPFAFDPDRVDRAELAELRPRPVSPRDSSTIRLRSSRTSTACSRQIARVRAAMSW